MSCMSRPASIVYGETIRPGNQNVQKLDNVTAFESYRKYLSEEIGKGEMDHVLRHACPGAGACGGMYTANTMASAIETLGMSLPYSSSIPATHQEKLKECEEAGRAIRVLLEEDIKPRDIITK